MARATRLVAQARATARAAVGWPIAAATCAYERFSPAGIARNASHTRCWNAVPCTSIGIDASSPSPRQVLHEARPAMPARPSALRSMAASGILGAQARLQGGVVVPERDRAHARARWRRRAGARAATPRCRSGSPSPCRRGGTRPAACPGARPTSRTRGSPTRIPPRGSPSSRCLPSGARSSAAASRSASWYSFGRQAVRLLERPLQVMRAHADLAAERLQRHRLVEVPVEVLAGPADRRGRRLHALRRADRSAGRPGSPRAPPPPAR